MQPAWQKCQGNVWGPFSTVDLSHPHFNNMEGVYIIWQGNGPVVRVGQGVIRDRLAAHRRDTAIMAYPNLYVTWAPVSAIYRDGVERHLANTLKPRVGDAFPNANPIQVLLPWPWQM
jgi:hypothetical protein